MIPEFEFDSVKSMANKAKHGIDFEAAKEIWADKRLLEAPARTTDEPRWLAIGIVAGKHWVAVFTRRSKAVRLISVRRAREQEIAAYESTDV